MSAEKMIKAEAKHSLSGNWVVAEVALAMVLVFPIVAAMIAMASYGVVGDDSVRELFESGSLKAWLFVLLNLIAVASFILLSPVFTGYARVYSKLAEGEEADAAEIFHYFDSKQRYRSAVVFMSRLIVKSAVIIVMLLIPALFVYSLDTEDSFFIGTAIALGVIGIIAALLIMHRFLFSLMLFSHFDYDSSNAISVGGKIARNNTGKLIKLTFSFILWIALLFTVLPFVYVVPYMTAAYFTSAKYLIKGYLESANTNSYSGTSNYSQTAVNQQSLGGESVLQ